MREMITRRRKMKSQKASDCVSRSVMAHREMFQYRGCGANWQWRSERQETLEFISRLTHHTHVKLTFFGYVITVCYCRGLEGKVPIGVGHLSEKYMVDVPKPLRFTSHSSWSDNHYLFSHSLITDALSLHLFWKTLLILFALASEW
jgi:hypothetical protein